MKFILYSTQLWYKLDDSYKGYIELLKKANIPYEETTVKSFGKAFCITINTLDELMKFADAIPDEIIISKHFVDGLREIEIYDDYRE